MKKDLTLVILAAGMGSRFGGLKQIEPIGPNGEFIIDYSIYDAIRAGFTKIVFIIKEENYEIFRDTIGKRIEGHIDVEYVFQDLNDVPSEFEVPSNRVKPWGTAHAILSCKDVIKGNFVMINSDDFYGYDAYKKIYDFFKEDNNDYAMVSFKVINTMSGNGSVKRGVCECLNSYLTNIIESSLEFKVPENREDGIDIIATPLDGREEFSVNPEDLVSMNFFGFRNDIFEILESGFKKFLENNKNNLEKCEYLIPDVVFETIKNGKKVKVLESVDKWLGVTYKEDKDFVVKELNNLIEKGEYPYELWK